MSSRKRPHDATKPDTPTNGLNLSLQDIDLQNGSNSSMEDSNGHNKSNGDNDQYSIKYVSNKPVSKRQRTGQVWGKWESQQLPAWSQMNFLIKIFLSR